MGKKYHYRQRAIKAIASTPKTNETKPVVPLKRRLRSYPKND